MHRPIAWLTCTLPTMKWIHLFIRSLPQYHGFMWRTHSPTLRPNRMYRIWIKCDIFTIHSVKREIIINDRFSADDGLFSRALCVRFSTPNTKSDRTMRQKIMIKYMQRSELLGIWMKLCISLHILCAQFLNSSIQLANWPPSIFAHSFHLPNRMTNNMHSINWHPHSDSFISCRAPITLWTLNILRNLSYSCMQCVYW